MMLIGFRKVKCGANLGIQDALLMGESYDCVGKYVCRCVHIYVYTYSCLSACVCRNMYTYICVYRKVVNLGCLPQSLSTLVFERESLSLNLELTKFSYVGCPASPGILCLCIFRTGIKFHSAMLGLLCMDPGDQTQILILRRLSL